MADFCCTDVVWFVLRIIAYLEKNNIKFYLFEVDQLFFTN